MDKIRVGISDYEESSFGDITDSHNTSTVTNLYSEPLIRLYDGKIWPALAQSWQSFDDGYRWLFYLRPNIMFHDSTPCSVVDVIESFEEIKSQSTKTGMPSPFERYFSKLNFRIINRLTLEVTCDTPCGDVAEILSGITIRRTKRNEKPVIGTGNYTYAKYYAGKTVRLEKRSGLKHLSAYDQITFYIIPDAEERLAALKKGTIHFAANLEQLPGQAQEHAGRRRKPARPHDGHLRVADGQLERAQPQALPAVPGGRRRRRAAGQPAHQGGRRHADGQRHAVHAAHPGSRRHEGVRRQHGTDGPHARGRDHGRGGRVGRPPCAFVA